MGNLLKTNLKGKINNLPHFKSEALMPVFEAVINSIQAIEEGDNQHKGEITVKINRSLQEDLKGFDHEHHRKIIGFEVEDNGIGFNQENWDSFLTADSVHKLEKGCKGVGRFFWLKAFSLVEIESVYQNNDKRQKRKINFSIERGIEEICNEESQDSISTKVVLTGFKKEYEKQPSAYKTTKKIAQRILEHCLSYYITGIPPQIIVMDDEEKYNLSELYKEIQDEIKVDNIEIEDIPFSISHIKLYSTYSQMHNLVLCANSRDVKSIKIDKHLGTTAEFDKDDKKFTYAVYVTSPYLDEHVDSTRIGFNIPDKSLPIDKEDYPVSINEIITETIEKSKDYLVDYLRILNDRKVEIVSTYVAKVNPTLRAIPTYCPELFNEIDPSTSDEKIDEILYKYKGKTEYSIKKRGEKLLKTQASSIDEIKEEFTTITNELEDLQKDQLASYVIFRKMIISLLDKKLELNKDGKYNNEDIIHDIIFPRKTSTDLLDFQEHNLWLIDERLTFHEFAYSDKPFDEISDSDSSDRADIVTFAEIDEDKIARTVSILEFKKPERKHFDEDPVKQLYRYVRKIRENKIKLPNGRELRANETTRFYCYAICDINKAIDEFAENGDFSKLKDGLGYYTYNGILKAHVEIIAFDKIVADVKKRHKAFFEKLGIG